MSGAPPPEQRAAWHARLGDPMVGAVLALGITQITAWGTSYYSLGVLAGPISRDTGWSRGFVFLGFTVALLAMGMVSSTVGRAIDRHGAPAQRLSRIADIDSGVTLCWHAPGYAKPWAHIAVIDAVIARGDPLTFTVIQSGGPVQGVHSEVWSKKASEIKTDKNGHLYVSGYGGAATVYFCSPLSRSPCRTSRR